MNQLTQETLLDGTTIAYEYDAAGNRTKKTVGANVTNYTYDNGNQLTAVNGQTYTYDSNGNLTSNGPKTYVYNEVNQLVEIKNTGGSTIATFTYDDQGRRISMTVSGSTANFHYNGDKVVYVTDANNNVTAEYTWDAAGNPVTMTYNGATYTYHLDGHGSVTAMTDASGNTVAQYQYDAWGNILSQSGAMSSINPYRYSGYRYDEATGLYYLMARYYDASVGRFITRDTFHGFEDDPQSLNQYLYTKNNPVMFIDPDGHNPVKIIYLLLKYLYQKFGVVVAKKAWAIVEPQIKKAVKNLKKFQIRLFPSKTRILSIIDKDSTVKDKTVFALDYHQYTENGRRTKGDVLHAHFYPVSEQKHIPIWPQDPFE